MRGRAAGVATAGRPRGGDRSAGRGARGEELPDTGRGWRRSLGVGVAQRAGALAGMVLCLVAGRRRSGPNDLTMGATLLVALLRLAQIVVAIVATFTAAAAWAAFRKKRRAAPTLRLMLFI